MFNKSTFLVPATLIALSFTVLPSAVSAKDWYFYVKNATSSTIKELLVSETKSNWGGFDIGAGIAPGAQEKLIWDESTNNEGCNQWIKAVFSDGTESSPSKIDFCQDLDDPIVFQ